ncbi:MAG TPA: class I SAM-dependent methyltransferase [Candidatus Paceibacterota bacterium]|nr:class I SAM-dependent methyltransferase [Candidatus Paceibacterota bacterium]
MKNIIEQKPTDKLHGRTLFSTRFVADEDIEGKEILNIGCGFGWAELNFFNRGGKKMIGIEITEDDLKTAKENLKDDKYLFKVGSALDIPFGNESLDTAVSFEVLEHIPKNTENKMFSEVSRVLRKGGIFYLSTPYKSFPSMVFDPAWWLIGHRHYSKKDLEIFEKEGGFEILSIKVKGGFWNLLELLNMYFSKWVLRRKSVFADFFNKKIDDEYKKENGFMNIFVKLKKIK